MSEKLTHAGAVAYRKRGGQVEFLVVTSSNGEHWVLPKGHIEPGESPGETAIRELGEEAGVGGELVEPLTIQSVRLSRETIRVQYFLVHGTETGDAAEERAVEWLPASDAAARLSFDDARAALHTALSAVSRM